MNEPTIPDMEQRFLTMLADFAAAPVDQDMNKNVQLVPQKELDDGSSYVINKFGQLWTVYYRSQGEEFTIFSVNGRRVAVSVLVTDPMYKSHLNRRLNEYLLEMIR